MEVTHFLPLLAPEISPSELRMFPRSTSHNIRARKRFRLTEKQQEIVDRVGRRYKKATRLVRAIFKHGIALHAELLRGRNPYAEDGGSHGYMELVCDALLGEGFERGELQTRFQTELDWSEQTARSCELVCVHALDELGIIVRDGRKYQLKVEND